ncbi:hypothetical protein HLH44_14305 [Gluconacetobacter sp. 1c LMG 22058]|uniref:Uncharacterized protein n=1 Tax=Gluconacetobacter dulcium TaxID=2729096 RepID=A0A7W4K1E4_9PROT|nr:hypothetical protein [Gluconacetobacter dulcium]MBB2198613.1 hypothetical protein [Gluconacetobacter dulcium]
MMSDKFLNALEYVAGSDAHSIWKDLNPGVNIDVNSKDSMRELICFFSFAIERNIIVEYSTEKNIPIFSGDAPDVLASRIFQDFSEKVPNVPLLDPLSNDDFVAYLMFKRGWAVLVHGTCLMVPE